MGANGPCGINVGQVSKGIGAKKPNSTRQCATCSNMHRRRVDTLVIFRGNSAARTKSALHRKEEGYFDESLRNVGQAKMMPCLRSNPESFARDGLLVYPLILIKNQIDQF